MSNEDKQISKFMEFEVKENTPSNELGISSKKAKKVGSLIPYVVCPLCCFSHKLNKTGQYARTSKKRNVEGNERKYRSIKFDKGTQIFGTYDFNEPFISLRSATGRGSGFPEVAIIRMKDIINLSDEDKALMTDLLIQVRKQCQTIIDYIDEVEV